MDKEFLKECRKVSWDYEEALKQLQNVVDKNIDYPKYYLGVLKEEYCNYCLMMKRGNDSKFVILTKQMRLEDEIEFDKEVTNLVKYFNAEVIVEDFVDRYKFPKKSLETYSSPIAKTITVDTSKPLFGLDLEKPVMIPISRDKN